MNISLIFLLSFLTVLFGVFLIRHLAIRLQIGSLPSPRKMHTEFKPLLGGIGFTVGIVVAMVLAQALGILPGNVWQKYLFFWLGLAVILLVGLWDDVKGISSKIKFAGEGIAAVLLIVGGCKIQSFSGPMGGVLPLGVFALPFTFLWIIFVINAVNLMDGLDGLAGGIGLLLTAGFFAIALKTNNLFLLILATGLAGGLLGFLRYNYHPASIFMGEVGSLQLGYLLAFFSVEALKVAGTHQVYFLTSLVMLGVPLSDTLISFLRRLGQGQSPFLADKQHIHHRLINLGLTHLQTVWMLYIFTALYVVLGVLMVYFPGTFGVVLFIIAFLFALYWVWRLGYVETRFSHQKSMYQSDRMLQVQSRAPLHLNRIWHKILLLFSDLIMLNVALYFTYWLKFNSGIFQPEIYRPASDYFSTPVFLLLTLGWILLFWINNLYDMPWDVSRFDKVWRVSKVITFGILILGIVTADVQEMMNRTQMMSLFCYWASLVGFVNLGRLAIIEMEKRWKIFEYSPKNTLIIGCNELGERVLKESQHNPHLMFNVVGFVAKKAGKKEFLGLPVLGNYGALPELIHRYKVEELIIALGEEAKDDFIQILSLSEPQQVKIKVPPGTHEIFSGQQEGLISHAYLKVFPENMVLWQWIIKRGFDFLTALSALILLSPVFLFISLYVRGKFKKSPIIKIPILGKHGIPFNMFVFRITEKDYDYHRNPVYLGVGASPDDFRGILKFLYKTRLYKLPQIINVLLGDMSFVGPRPEPPEWYEEYRDTLRLTHWRIMIRPGITGLAQVKYHYELSQKILQERVNYDIFYIENISIRLDIRILLRTLLLVFKGPPGKIEASGD